jgi:hypothetical protein
VQRASNEARTEAVPTLSIDDTSAAAALHTAQYGPSCPLQKQISAQSPRKFEKKK